MINSKLSRPQRILCRDYSNHWNYDIHNYAQRLKLAYSKIQREECLTDEDRELLTKFGKYLEAMDLNAGRTAKAIYQPSSKRQGNTKPSHHRKECGKASVRSLVALKEIFRSISLQSSKR